MTGIRFSIHSPVELESRLREAAAARGWTIQPDPQARVYSLRHPTGGVCRVAAWPVEGGLQVAPLGSAETVEKMLRDTCRRMRQADPYLHEGATEAQMSDRGQVPQRIDSHGTKVEDLVGVGKHDSQGG
jgi:hypothetical protein